MRLAIVCCSCVGTKKQQIPSADLPPGAIAVSLLKQLSMCRIVRCRFGRQADWLSIRYVTYIAFRYHFWYVIEIAENIHRMHRSGRIPTTHYATQHTIEMKCERSTRLCEHINIVIGILFGVCICIRCLLAIALCAPIRRTKDALLLLLLMSFRMHVKCIIVQYTCIACAE